MSLESDIELLGRVPLFSGLPLANLRLLAFSAERRELASGDSLFRRGDRARSGFVVNDGAIELAIGAGEGRQILESCERGYLIGEIPLFVDAKRPADAVAREKSGVLEISRQLMRRMLTEYPEVAERLYARMAERLAGTISELQKVRDALLTISS